MLRSSFLIISRFPAVNSCRFYPRKSRLSNPGIDGRIQMLQEEKMNTIELEDVEEDFESDFMNVHKVHKQYVEESKEHQEKLSYWITRDKYFKVKQDNFLTWSEKEQIRFLHRDSPSEWTVEKLAESFPAGIVTIEKILKASWLPRDDKRIRKHDENVQRNWQAFRKGKIENLSNELRDHLKKFGHRKFDLDATPKVHLENTREHALKLPVGEFTKILTTCKGYMQIEQKKNENLAVEAPKEDLMRTVEFPVAVKGHLTFDQLKKSGEMSIKEDIGVKDDNQPAVPVSGEEMEIFNVKKFNSVPATQEKKHRSPHKQKIYIPKHLWKRGGTYKMDDCFYDDDGEFLYRVPGLTGTN
ncbi:uncharacterized protein DMENIID0001_072850 [Sergentomyia squamirostris]